MVEIDSCPECGSVELKSTYVKTKQVVDQERRKMTDVDIYSVTCRYCGEYWEETSDA